MTTEQLVYLFGNLSSAEEKLQDIDDAFTDPDQVCIICGSGPFDEAHTDDCLLKEAHSIRRQLDQLQNRCSSHHNWTKEADNMEVSEPSWCVL